MNYKTNKNGTTSCLLDDLNYFDYSTKEDYEISESLFTNSNKEQEMKNMQNEKLMGLVRSIIDGSESDIITYSEIMSKLPTAYQDLSLVRDVIYDLYDAGRVVPMGLSYVRILDMNLDVLLDSIPQSKKKNIFIAKLSGMQTSDIQEKYNVSRQYVHSCIDKLLKKYHIVELEEEIAYRSTFEKYEFKKDSFMACFEEAGEVYELLALICKPNKLKRLPLDQILESDELEECEKENLNNYFHKHEIEVNGEYVTMKHTDIIDFILTHYCTQPTSLKEFDEMYKALLKKCPVKVRKQLSIYDTSRICISHREDVLWISSDHFRYYPIQHEDLMKLYNNVNFYKYNNQVISASKIFNDHRLLMREIDIKDGKELHALLKRTFSDNGPGIECEFSRNPTIIFGNRVLEDELEELIEANSPIKSKDLVQLIVDNFGFDKGTVIGAYLPLLRKYNMGGVYCSYKDNTDSGEIIA